MIDINTLTIGSHVLFNGERVEIEGISKIGLVYGVKTINDETWYHPDDLDPIPITEELLTELGFEKGGSNAYTKYFCESEYFERVIQCCFLNDYRSTWTITYWDDDNRDYHIGAEYLHELEAFVYLTTKQRLI